MAKLDKLHSTDLAALREWMTQTDMENVERAVILRKRMVPTSSLLLKTENMATFSQSG
jgi:hypothetical protein